MNLKKISDAGVTVLDCEHKTPSPLSEGHPYIAIPDLQDGRINIHTARRISSEDLAEWTRRTRPQVGDVVVTRRGRVGDSAPIPQPDCAIGQNLVILRSNGIEIDQTYLRWAVRGPQWWAGVRKVTNVGAIFSSLNVRDIGKIEIPCPPMAEQQAIAEVLGALDDKIAINDQTISTASALADAFAQQAAEVGHVRALDALASIVMGSSPKGESFNELSDGIVMYQGNRDFGVRFPSPRVWTTAPVRSAEIGDLLISVRAPVGAINVAEEDCCIGRGLAAVKAEHPAALLHLISTQRAELFASFNADGTIFGAINKAQLASLPIRCPESGLESLEDQVAPLEQLIQSLVRESRTLAELRDTLLPALMDGTIRVPDAINKAEEVL